MYGPTLGETGKAVSLLSRPRLNLLFSYFSIVTLPLASRDGCKCSSKLVFFSLSVFLVRWYLPNRLLGPDLSNFLMCCLMSSSSPWFWTAAAFADSLWYFVGSTACCYLTGSSFLVSTSGFFLLKILPKMELKGCWGIWYSDWEVVWSTSILLDYFTWWAINWNIFN